MRGSSRLQQAVFVPFRYRASLPAVVAVMLVAPAAPAADAVRHIAFTYSAMLDSLPAGVGPVHIFLPIATNTPHQQVLSREITASIPGELREEPGYGNLFWHGMVAESDGAPITVDIRCLVRRSGVSASADAAPEADRASLARFLAPNALVPVGGELIDPIADTIAPGEDSPRRIARAVYDYVIDHMVYSKEGAGWGAGNTSWACDARYGNCTDFHALFISLARARGIPARFEIGFPIPMDRSAGRVTGYHCWVNFHLPGAGWIPADASEARKHPGQRDFLFGNLRPDRIRFSVGRDLELGKGHTTGPLNFFIYPHVEVAGKIYEGVTTRFAFEERHATTP